MKEDPTARKCVNKKSMITWHGGAKAWVQTLSSGVRALYILAGDDIVFPSHLGNSFDYIMDKEGNGKKRATNTINKYN